MKHLEIDYSRLVRLLTPTLLRHSLFLALLDACVSPIAVIYSLFGRQREANLYHLSITPQVCYLEKALNDRFDTDVRRIYIGDGIFYDQQYIYTENEAHDEYIYTDAEAQDTYIYTADESGTESVDFIVYVPIGLSFNDAEMRAILDQYKLASKRYSIVKI